MADDPKPNWADDPPPTVLRDADGKETEAGRKLREQRAKIDAELAKRRDAAAS